MKLLFENQTVCIPVGAVHRTDVPHEVQTGSYLGEDGIVRYEHVYDQA